MAPPEIAHGALNGHENEGTCDKREDVGTVPECPDGTITILADDRERAVNEHLVHLHGSTRIMRLTTGDFVLRDATTLYVVVERKTVSDFMASICDGRMENHAKMAKLRDETSCRIVYLVEGDPCAPQDTRVRGIPLRNMMGKLDSLMFRDNVAIVWARDPPHAAERLSQIACCIQRNLKKDAREKDPKGFHMMQRLTRVHTKTPTETRTEALSKIDGVSLATARAIAGKVSLRTLLYSMDEETLASYELPCGSRIGARAAKILAQLRPRASRQLQGRILSCANGLTVELAARILQEFDMYAIWEGGVPVGAIADIHRAGDAGRRVGRALEGKIRDLLGTLGDTDHS